MIIVSTIGDASTRDILLAPIRQQDEDIKSYRRQRRALVDIDPDTGDPLEDEGPDEGVGEELDEEGLDEEGLGEEGRGRGARRRRGRGRGRGRGHVARGRGKRAAVGLPPVRGGHDLCGTMGFARRVAGVAAGAADRGPAGLKTLAKVDDDCQRNPLGLRQATEVLGHSLVREWGWHEEDAAMVQPYWEIGLRLVEQEQRGERLACSVF